MALAARCRARSRTPAQPRGLRDRSSCVSRLARGRTKACAGAGAGEQHQLRGQASIWQAQEEASKEVSGGVGVGGGEQYE